MRVEAEIGAPPGEVILRLVMTLGMRAGGSAPAPRATATGTSLSVRPLLLRGNGEILVRAREHGTTVELVGHAPPFPFSMGWGPRLLRRLLGPEAVVSSRSPGSAG